MPMKENSRAAGNLSAIQGAHGNRGSQLPSTRPNEKALSGQLILLVSVRLPEEECMRPDEVKNVTFIKTSANRRAESQNGITPEWLGSQGLYRTLGGFFLGAYDGKLLHLVKEDG